MSNWKSYKIINGGSYRTGIGAATLNNRLHFAYQSDAYSENALYIGSFEWHNGEPVNYQSEQPLAWDAKVGLGMTVHNGVIYMAYEGTGSGGIYVAASADGQTWGTLSHMADWYASRGVGIVSFNNQLFMVCNGTNSSGVYINSSADGKVWKTVKHEDAWGVASGIGLTVFNNKLYCAYEGTGSGGIYLASSTDGVSWTSDRISGWEASVGIGLGVWNGKLIMAYEGTGAGNRLYIATSANPTGSASDWSSEQITGWDANGGIGMTALDDKLFIIYEGSGSGGIYAGVFE